MRNNILDKVIVHAEQRFKTMREFRFVEQLNLIFFTKGKNPNIRVFNFEYIYKHIDLDRLKYELKPVCAEDFAKHASNILEI